MGKPPRDLDVDELWNRLWLKRKTRKLPLEYLVELHRRGTREIFERALAACRSRDRRARLLGVLVLRELGNSPPTFAAEAQPFLIAMLEKEPSPRVRRWIISAIGYQNMDGNVVPPGYDRGMMEPRALSAILPYAHDKNALVRFAVAASLPGLVDLQEPEDASVETLIQLASDSNADTHYHALAGLVDDLGLGASEAVRSDLEQRSNDHDPQIRRCVRRVLEGGAWGENETDVTHSLRVGFDEQG